MSELTTQDQAEEQGPARTVVVAEDEALIRLDIVEILKDQGFDVVAETDNGKTAVELAQKHRPDLVLMDVKMPIMDGITAAGGNCEGTNRSRRSADCIQPEGTRRPCR